MSAADSAPALPDAQYRALAPRLERHAVGRAQGLAGIAVLAGDVPQAVALWQRWHAARGGAVITDAAERGAVIRAYLAGLLADRDLVSDIAGLLAPHVGMAPAELAARLPRQGLPERMGMFRRLEAAVDPALLAICQRLLGGAGVDSLRPDATTLPLVAALSGRGAPPAAPLPGLLLADTAPERDRTDAAEPWLARAAATALHLVGAAPGLIAGVAADPARLEAFLDTGPDTHVKARIREGLLPLPAPPAPAGQTPGDVVDAAGPDPEALARDARWVRVGMEQERVSANVLAAFDEAVRLLGREALAAGPTEADDRARSAAERFLHQYLGEHPETAGLFALNRRLPFDFGPRAAEVDLVSERLAVAIEIDGYHHFRDPERFRRDRRKDVLLQRHGYFVVRCLARDVVGRLGEVMDLILDAVRAQRQRREDRER